MINKKQDFSNLILINVVVKWISGSVEDESNISDTGFVNLRFNHIQNIRNWKIVNQELKWFNLNVNVKIYFHFKKKRNYFDWKRQNWSTTCFSTKSEKASFQQVDFRVELNKKNGLNENNGQDLSLKNVFWS